MLQIIGIIVALIFVVVSIAILDTDIELTILLVGAIYITDITTTEDVTVLACQLFHSTYRTTVHVHLCLSEYVTVRVERAALTEVVISAAATEYVAMYVAFNEFYICLTCLIDTYQGADAVVLTCSIDDTTTNGSNLTTAEEGIADVSAIHLHIGDIHTTVVDVATTEDTTTVIQSVGAVARPGLVVQFLLIVIRAYLNIFEVGICGGYAVEVSITDISIVECDIRGTEYGTTLTTTVCITLDGRKTVNKAGAVFLANDNVCFTKNVVGRRGTDGSLMVAYTSLPTAAIDVTCRTTFDIGIGRSDEWLVEVVIRYIVFVVD